MKLKIESNKVFKPLWKSNKRYIILAGGRSGGRSYEASQKLIAYCYQNSTFFRGAIMRAVHTDIRHSIWQEALDRVAEWELKDIDLGFSTMEMKRGKNSIHAHGFRKSSSERTAKLKSLASYTHAFIEEAEEIGEEEFMQLDDSLRAEGSQIHLLFNIPPKSHWLIKRWFNLLPNPDRVDGFYQLELKPEYKNDVEFIFSTHQDNPYVSEDVHKRYEAYKDTKPEYYYQMIRGLCPEVLMGRIYSNWKEIDEIPHEARLLGYGLDFGYDPDPAAIVAVYYHNGGYILDEKLYENKLLNDQLASNIKLYDRSIVVADSAEPKSIEEIRRYGINIIPCAKGRESVAYSIKHVQGLKISYTKNSHNLKNEYENYGWKIDKDGLNLGIEDPTCPNHLMSAARYFLSAIIKADADPEAMLRQKEKLDTLARQTKNKLTQTTR